MPRPPTPDEDLEKLERLTAWLDDAFRVPGTGFRFGLDPIVGLLPGIGDAVTTVFTAVLIHHAQRHRLPFAAQLRMLGNLGLDWIVGSVPVVGDVFDFGFRANRRNLEIVKRHLAQRAAGQASGRGGSDRTSG